MSTPNDQISSLQQTKQTTQNPSQLSNIAQDSNLLLQQTNINPLQISLDISNEFNEYPQLAKIYNKDQVYELKDIQKGLKTIITVSSRQIQQKVETQRNKLSLILENFTQTEKSMKGDRNQIDQVEQHQNTVIQCQKNPQILKQSAQLEFQENKPDRLPQVCQPYKQTNQETNRNVQRPLKHVQHIQTILNQSIQSEEKTNQVLQNIITQESKNNQPFQDIEKMVQQNTKQQTDAENTTNSTHIQKQQNKIDQINMDPIATQMSDISKISQKQTYQKNFSSQNNTQGSDLQGQRKQHVAQFDNFQSRTQEWQQQQLNNTNQTISQSLQIREQITITELKVRLQNEDKNDKNLETQISSQIQETAQIQAEQIQKQAKILPQQQSIILESQTLLSNQNQRLKILESRMQNDSSAQKILTQEVQDSASQNHESTKDKRAISLSQSLNKKFPATSNSNQSYKIILKNTNSITIQSNLPPSKPSLPSKIQPSNQTTIQNQGQNIISFIQQHQRKSNKNKQIYQLKQQIVSSSSSSSSSSSVQQQSSSEGQSQIFRQQQQQMFRKLNNNNMNRVAANRYFNNNRNYLMKQKNLSYQKQKSEQNNGLTRQKLIQYHNRERQYFKLVLYKKYLFDRKDGFIEQPKTDIENQQNKEYMTQYYQNLFQAYDEKSQFIQELPQYALRMIQKKKQKIKNENNQEKENNVDEANKKEEIGKIQPITTEQKQNEKTKQFYDILSKEEPLTRQQFQSYYYKFYTSYKYFPSVNDRKNQVDVQNQKRNQPKITQFDKNKIILENQINQKSNKKSQKLSQNTSIQQQQSTKEDHKIISKNRQNVSKTNQNEQINLQKKQLETHQTKNNQQNSNDRIITQNTVQYIESKQTNYNSNPFPISMNRIRGQTQNSDERSFVINENSTSRDNMNLPTNSFQQQTQQSVSTAQNTKNINNIETVNKRVRSSSQASSKSQKQQKNIKSQSSNSISTIQLSAARLFGTHGYSLQQLNKDNKQNISISQQKYVQMLYQINLRTIRRIQSFLNKPDDKIQLVLKDQISQLSSQTNQQQTYHIQHKDYELIKQNMIRNQIINLQSQQWKVYKYFILKTHIQQKNRGLQSYKVLFEKQLVKKMYKKITQFLINKKKTYLNQNSQNNLNIQQLFSTQNTNNQFLPKNNQNNKKQNQTTLLLSSSQQLSFQSTSIISLESNNNNSLQLQSSQPHILLSSQQQSQLLMKSPNPQQPSNPFPFTNTNSNSNSNNKFQKTKQKYQKKVNKIQIKTTIQVDQQQEQNLDGSGISNQISEEDKRNFIREQTQLLSLRKKIKDNMKNNLDKETFNKNDSKKLLVDQVSLKDKLHKLQPLERLSGNKQQQFGLTLLTPQKNQQNQIHKKFLQLLLKHNGQIKPSHSQLKQTYPSLFPNQTSDNWHYSKTGLKDYLVKTCEQSFQSLIQDLKASKYKQQWIQFGKRLQKLDRQNFCKKIVIQPNSLFKETKLCLVWYHILKSKNNYSQFQLNQVIQKCVSCFYKMINKSNKKSLIEGVHIDNIESDMKASHHQRSHSQGHAHKQSSSHMNKHNNQHQNPQSRNQRSQKPNKSIQNVQMHHNNNNNNNNPAQLQKLKLIQQIKSKTKLNSIVPSQISKSLHMNNLAKHYVVNQPHNSPNMKMGYSQSSLTVLPNNYVQSQTIYNPLNMNIKPNNNFNNNAYIQYSNNSHSHSQYDQSQINNFSLVSSNAYNNNNNNNTNNFDSYSQQQSASTTIIQQQPYLSFNNYKQANNSSNSNSNSNNYASNHNNNQNIDSNNNLIINSISFGNNNNHDLVDQIGFNNKMQDYHNQAWQGNYLQKVNLMQQPQLHQQQNLVQAKFHNLRNQRSDKNLDFSRKNLHKSMVMTSKSSNKQSMPYQNQYNIQNTVNQTLQNNWNTQINNLQQFNYLYDTSKGKKIKANLTKGINPISPSSINPSNLQVLNQLPQLQPKKRTYEQHLDGLNEKINNSKQQIGGLRRIDTPKVTQGAAFMSVNNMHINKQQNFPFNSPSQQYQSNIKNPIQKTNSSPSNMQSNMNTNNFKLTQSQSMKNLSNKPAIQKPQISAQNTQNSRKSLDNSSQSQVQVVVLQGQSKNKKNKIGNISSLFKSTLNVVSNETINSQAGRMDGKQSNINLSNKQSESQIQVINQSSKASKPLSSNSLNPNTSNTAMNKAAVPLTQAIESTEQSSIISQTLSSLFDDFQKLNRRISTNQNQIQINEDEQKKKKKNQVVEL